MCGFKVFSEQVQCLSKSAMMKILEFFRLSNELAVVDKRLIGQTPNFRSMERVGELFQYIICQNSGKVFCSRTRCNCQCLQVTTNTFSTSSHLYTCTYTYSFFWLQGFPPYVQYILKFLFHFLSRCELSKCTHTFITGKNIEQSERERNEIVTSQSLKQKICSNSV